MHSESFVSNSMASPPGHPSPPLADVPRTGHPSPPNGSPTGHPSPHTDLTMNEVAAIIARHPPSTYVNTSPPSDGTRSNRASPITTARKNKKSQSKPQPKIKKDGRVKVTRGNLYHLLSEEQQKKCPNLKNLNNKYNMYGTIVSGNSLNGYTISFDDLPFEDKLVFVKRRSITAVDPSESNLYDFATDDPNYMEFEEQQQNKKKKESPNQVAVKNFVELDDEVKAVARVFDMPVSDKGDELLSWRILLDCEHLPRDSDPMSYPLSLRLKKEIDFGNGKIAEDSKKWANIFFDHFFPCIKGHAKLLDKFHSNIKSPCYNYVQHNKVIFHRDDEDDADWIVKQAYLLVIAAATEPTSGTENLWKIGPHGRRDGANFGQFLPETYFRAFVSGAPFMFNDEEYWYLDKRDKPWEIFLPAVESYNEKRRGLFNTDLLMLDESMSAWCPKTTATGGLPNISYEPRKPKPLGTMFRNAIECFSGTMAFQNIHQQPELQQLRGFYYSDNENRTRALSSLPGSPEITAPTAEVLRLCKGAGLEEGGWVGGDAWFGSVMSSLELRKQLNVFSTFVVKNNHHLFPMEVLTSILRARHGDKPAGHWVVMTTEISGETVVAIAYAWSQKGISYFVSTCGCTAPSTTYYESKFENAWGHVEARLLERPEIVHFLYEYLPLIDEHNKQRQSLLNLETKWKTRSPWFRLITTLCGQSVVDMHRYYRYQEIMKNGRRQSEVDSMGIIEFSDFVCKSLRLWPRKVSPEQLLSNSRYGDTLTRIQTKDGTSTTYEPTDKQRQLGKTVGTSVHLQCYICRGFTGRNDKTIVHTTSFWCKHCHMPICQQDRKNQTGTFGAPRTHTCLEMHLLYDGEFGCCGHHVRGKEFPKDKKINLWGIVRTGIN